MCERANGKNDARIWRAVGAVALAGSLLGAGSGTAMALSYSAKPINASVIDADTRQPLSGVIVLVVWSLQDARGGGGPYWIFEETVSDKSGHFGFAGWGPKKVPQEPGENPWRLGPDEPVLYLFKSGYPFGVVANPWESWMLGNLAWTGDLVRASIWDNKTIELRKFGGTEKQYLNALSVTAGGLPMQACRWSKIPRLTAALLMERGDRVQFPASSSLPTFKILEEKAANTPGCPAPRVILAPYLK